MFSSSLPTSVKCSFGFGRVLSTRPTILRGVTFAIIVDARFPKNFFWPTEAAKGAKFQKRESRNRVLPEKGQGTSHQLLAKDCSFKHLNPRHRDKNRSFILAVSIAARCNGAAGKQNLYRSRLPHFATS